MTSTYYARSGSVYVADGPWEARLDERQCDALLTIWDEANAVSLFNSLFEACQAAGYGPSTYGRRVASRLVEA